MTKSPIVKTPFMQSNAAMNNQLHNPAVNIVSYVKFKLHNDFAAIIQAFL